MIKGTEPVVRYYYPESGNYTLRLKVGVDVTKYRPQITGDYSMDVKVLGLYCYITKHINLLHCLCTVYQIFKVSYLVLHLEFLETN